MKKLIIILELLLLVASAACAQELEDYAKSINLQSPSKWINGYYRLMGASYKAQTFSIQFQIKDNIYFDPESHKKNPVLSKQLLACVISSLYYNKNYRALINAIIKNNANLEITLSTPNSKAKSTNLFTSILLKNTISNNLLSQEELFIKGHVIATNIECPSSFEDGLWLEMCMLEENKIVYYVSCSYLDNDPIELEIIKPVMKSLFWDTMLKLPTIEKLFRSCLATKTDIYWLVKDSKTGREFFTFRFGEKEIKYALDIK